MLFVVIGDNKMRNYSALICVKYTTETDARQDSCGTGLGGKRGTKHG